MAQLIFLEVIMLPILLQKKKRCIRRLRQEFLG